MPTRALLASTLALFMLCVAMPTASRADHHGDAGVSADVPPDTSVSTQAAPADGTPALAWSAERMSALTDQLATQMRDVRNAFRKSPNFRSSESPNRRAADEMANTLKRLDKSCASLAKRVGKGEGAEETRGLARQIATLLNDADQEARKLMTDSWTQQRVAPAMATINEIAGYYGRGPLYDLDTMQRTDRPKDPGKRKSGE